GGSRTQGGRAGIFVPRRHGLALPGAQGLRRLERAAPDAPPQPPAREEQLPSTASEASFVPLPSSSPP
ncbi:hypothetical protein P7K49_008811, partial [Saguinus oedipus]